jgi:hypothetical protein
MSRLRSLPRIIAVIAFITAGAVFAQGAPTPPSAPPAPPKLEPLPEIAPPPGLTGDVELEPQVTIKRRDGETVEEARVNGRLVWVKVTPRHGLPYFLVPDGSGNVYVRRDSHDTGLKVPLWVLLEF